MFEKEEKTLFMDWKIKNKDNIENVVITLLYYEKGVDTKTCYDEVDWLIQKAFLAGLKAGRPQWHFVKDGDLPKHEVNVLVLFNKQCIDIAHYNYDYKEWHFADSIVYDVIAWKEIVLPEGG